MTLVQGLASFAATLEPPADVRASVVQRVLDIMGVSIAATELDTSAAAIAHAGEQGGTGHAHAVGVEDALPAPMAAFVGGVLAHSLDYDDTHLPSVLHPSASVVPAALAAAQYAGATGTDLITAVAAGLEICVRLGMAGYDTDARDSLYFARGQHATSICGAIASAAAAARLIGLDANGIGHAMGLAVSMGSGVLEANRAGGTVKRLHCGLAAQAGVSAAMLARRGFTGPPTALEGRMGFFRAWLNGRYDPAPLTEGLGSAWEIPRIFFKPYPANHFTHAGIDAAIVLRDAGIKPDDIESATLGVAGATVRTIGEPIEQKRAPATGYQAQFSGPYTVAAAFFGGGGLGLGLDDFTDELATDPPRRALMERIAVKPDPQCDAIYPMQFPAVLRVRTRDGMELTHAVLTNRGGPDRPLSDEELRVKFRDNASRVLPADVVQGIERAVSELESLTDVAGVVRPAGRKP